MEENIYNSHYQAKNGCEFNYKNFLTEIEFETIIKEYLEILTSTDDDYRDNLGFTDLNLITSELIFDRCLGIACIENFDEDLHQKLFSSGVYDHLKQDIANAERAYNLAREIASKMDSISTVLNSLTKQMPTNLDISALSDELNQATNQYKEIVSNDTNQE